MTELLQVIFQRGQNEIVDPRLAPPEVHAIAQNVRWRKDGRPAKRYGVRPVSVAGLSAVGFPLKGANTQPVNAITSWNGVPVLAVGSSVRQQLPGAAGWDSSASADAGELSHFGPGKRDVVARDESTTIDNVSSGHIQYTVPTTFATDGLTLHAWDDGVSSVYFSVKSRDGATLITPRFLNAGLAPRIIVTGSYIYVLSKSAGGVLSLVSFEPLTLATAALASPGTLDSTASHFDACGRSVDFVISYQSAAAILTTKLFSAVATPALLQTQAAAIAATPSRIGVVTGAGASVFVAVQEPGSGNIKFAAWNTGLTALTGGGLIETDANNNAQPGLVLENTTTARIVWGGFVAATASSYMRACQVANVGAVPTSAIYTFYGVSPASKPFMGPASFAKLGVYDGAYLWVSTSNADAGSSKWDTQRAYLLVKFNVDAAAPLRRQMHVPNVAPKPLCQLHLSDATYMGVGYGYLTPLLNAVRFGNALAPAYGFDTVTARSIFESIRGAARDTVTAGRVLQFSGGSLFELNGAAEETGFSNYPVIQSITGGGGGALAGPGNYSYRAVYEWIDNQGRRHRSAPSDPVTFTPGANTSATLVMKPLVADAHQLSASGSSASRGVKLHVYRTLVGLGSYHRVTPNFGAPTGSGVGAATVSYTDLMADSVAAVQEFLYTDGGVAENTLCPPHTFQTVCNGRVWVGGQLDGNVITSSKLLVDGEPTQFSELEAFSSFLPQDCTGIASIDGTVVAFARERIYFITGDGPNDQGVGSFNPPTELPTDVGCIDWRSVVETSLGIFFQAKRGIYLLPRGFNTPVFVGAEVDTTLSAYPYIVSATLVTSSSRNASKLGETTVRFVAGNSTDNPTDTVVLVYDIRTQGWSTDGAGEGAEPFYGAALLSGTWGDAFITSRLTSLSILGLFSESPVPNGEYAAPDGSFIRTTLGTGDIRPFGVAGYGQFCKVVLMGEHRGDCVVNVAVSVDGASADAYSFTVTSSDAYDGTVWLDVTPKVQKGSSIRVTCWDAGNPTDPTEGFIMQALFIEHELIGKTKRLANARKA